MNQLLRFFYVQYGAGLLHCLNQKAAYARTCMRCAPGRLVNKVRAFSRPGQVWNSSKTDRRVNLEETV
jgi:hypothetical protein